jgi:DNA-binding transcriptional LysR family regulator
MQHELQGIQAFVKIAEIGCFTRASHFLHISQPAQHAELKNLKRVWEQPYSNGQPEM